MGDRRPAERDPLLAAEEGADAATPPAGAAADAPTSAAGRAWQWVVARARELKAEVLALYLAMDDPRTPWVARIGAAVVVGYALSPLDLIPDFIPVRVCLETRWERSGGGCEERAGNRECIPKEGSVTGVRDCHSLGGAACRLSDASRGHSAVATLVAATVFSVHPRRPPCFHFPTTPQVLGILDDIILLPLGIWLVRAAIPDDVLADARGRAAEMIARGERPPVNWVAGVVVVAIWLACAAWAAVALRGWLQGGKGGADGIAATGSGT